MLGFFKKRSSKIDDRLSADRLSGNMPEAPPAMAEAPAHLPSARAAPQAEAPARAAAGAARNPTGDNWAGGMVMDPSHAVPPMRIGDTIGHALNQAVNAATFQGALDGFEGFVVRTLPEGTGFATNAALRVGALQADRSMGLMYEHTPLDTVAFTAAPPAIQYMLGQEPDWQPRGIGDHGDVTAYGAEISVRAERFDATLLFHASAELVRISPEAELAPGTLLAIALLVTPR